jgi:hypothetical protein
MSAPSAKRLVLVVGVGRSGTSLLTGILGMLGCHIPTPEVSADDTNPKGFGEPRWVVDFHDRLLRRRRVTVNDARPVAFEKLAADPDVGAARQELRAWLKGELAQADIVVVKDPRTAWFLPLWTRCAADLGVDTSFVTMLRHPAEVLASARKSYGDWQGEASRAAAWLNVTLETEHATRGARRAFVRYDDLLADWSPQIRRLGTLLELPSLAGVQAAEHPAVNEFVDPTLHRNRVQWSDLNVPARVQDMAEEVWVELQPLAEGTPEPEGSAPRFDAFRTAYATLYAEAEAIAQNSIHAVRPRRRQGGKAGPPSLKVRVARRIPVRYRRQLRATLGRLRPRSAAGPRA